MWWRRTIVVLALGPAIALPLVLLAVFGFLDLLDLAACFAVTFLCAAILTFAVPAIRDLSNKRLMVLGLGSAVVFLLTASLGIALGVRNLHRATHLDEPGCWDPPYFQKTEKCDGRRRRAIFTKYNYYYFSSGMARSGACEEFKLGQRFKPQTCSYASEYKQTPCHVVGLKDAKHCFHCKRTEGYHRLITAYGFDQDCKNVMAISTANLEIDKALKMRELDRKASINSSTRQMASPQSGK